ncbi:hypothetical protein AKJ16_DCAP02358 [Drosera capensis]
MVVEIGVAMEAVERRSGDGKRAKRERRWWRNVCIIWWKRSKSSFFPNSQRSDVQSGNIKYGRPNAYAAAAAARFPRSIWCHISEPTEPPSKHGCSASKRTTPSQFSATKTTKSTVKGHGCETQLDCPSAIEDAN